MGKPESHDAYLSTLPEDRRAALQALREAVRRAAPDAEEVMSYGIPAFRQGKVLVGYAAMKAHLGFYVMSGDTLAGFAAELAGYSTARGTVRFTPDKPIGEDLVARIVRARLAETGAG